MLKSVKLTNLKNQVQQINIPKALSQHLLDESRSFTHRAITGIAIIFCGVCLTHILERSIINAAAGAIGEMIHAIGALPFLQKIEKWRVAA